MSLTQFSEKELQEFHDFCANHRVSIQKSQRCGCFYCLSFFKPYEIVEWVDADDAGRGLTALCPKCGIDSVLADADVSVSPELLLEMNKNGSKSSEKI